MTPADPAAGVDERRARVAAAHDRRPWSTTRSAPGSCCPASAHFIGLGARHGLHVDQAGRSFQLGADRAYTGPDCPPDMLDVGGIPQGDYAPVPWVLASRVGGVDRDRRPRRALRARRRGGALARGAAGPLRVHLFTHPTPLARLRAFLRLTGLAGGAPRVGATGTGRAATSTRTSATPRPTTRATASTASRSTRSCSTPPGRRNTTRGSSTRTSSRTRRATSSRLRADGVRTVVWVAPWVNLDSRDGQYPPDEESARLHAEPAPNYEPEHFVRDGDGEPFVARWWMGTGSPVDFTSAAAEEWWREQAKRVLALGVEGIKADDGEGWYLPDDVRFADGHDRRAVARGATGCATGARCSARSTRCIPARACCSGGPAGRASRPWA